MLRWCSAIRYFRTWYTKNVTECQHTPGSTRNGTGSTTPILIFSTMATDGTNNNSSNRVNELERSKRCTVVSVIILVLLIVLATTAAILFVVVEWKQGRSSSGTGIGSNNGNATSANETDSDGAATWEPDITPNLPAHCQPSSLEEYEKCLLFLDRAAAYRCASCVNAFLIEVASTLTTTTMPMDCQSFQSQFCTVLWDRCDCGVCAGAIQTWVDCSQPQQLQWRQQQQQQQHPNASASNDVEYCPIQCDNAVPVPDDITCIEQSTTASSCLARVAGLTGDEISACEVCVEQVIDLAWNRITCTGFRRDFCEALPDCPCGNCFADLATWSQCAHLQDDCSLQCPGF